VEDGGDAGGGLVSVPWLRRAAHHRQGRRRQQRGDKLGVGRIGMPGGMASEQLGEAVDDVSGIDLFCAGDPALVAGDEEVRELDTRRGRYKRLIVRVQALLDEVEAGTLAELREQAAGGAAAA